MNVYIILLFVVTILLDQQQETNSKQLSSTQQEQNFQKKIQNNLSHQQQNTNPKQSIKNILNQLEGQENKNLQIDQQIEFIQYKNKFLQNIQSTEKNKKIQNIDIDILNQIKLVNSFQEINNKQTTNIVQIKNYKNKFINYPYYKYQIDQIDLKYLKISYDPLQKSYYIPYPQRSLLANIPAYICQNQQNYIQIKCNHKCNEYRFKYEMFRHKDNNELIGCIKDDGFKKWQNAKSIFQIKNFLYLTHQQGLIEINQNTNQTSFQFAIIGREETYVKLQISKFQIQQKVIIAKKQFLFDIKNKITYLQKNLYENFKNLKQQIFYAKRKNITLLPNIKIFFDKTQIQITPKEYLDFQDSRFILQVYQGDENVLGTNFLRYRKMKFQKNYIYMNQVEYIYNSKNNFFNQQIQQGSFHDGIILQQQKQQYQIFNYSQNTSNIIKNKIQIQKQIQKYKQRIEKYKIYFINLKMIKGGFYLIIICVLICTIFRYCKRKSILHQEILNLNQQTQILIQS